MSFKVQDLVIGLATEVAQDRGWAVVIGCGAASVECDNTQRPPRPFKRLDPIDLETGLRSDDELLSLQYELQRKLESVERELSRGARRAEKPQGEEASGRAASRKRVSK